MEKRVSIVLGVVLALAAGPTTSSEPLDEASAKELVSDLCYALQAAMWCPNIKFQWRSEALVEEQIGVPVRGPGAPYNQQCAQAMLKVNNDENNGLCENLWEAYGCWGSKVPALVSGYGNRPYFCRYEPQMVDILLKLPAYHRHARAVLADDYWNIYSDNYQCDFWIDTNVLIWCHLGETGLGGLFFAEPVDSGSEFRLWAINGLAQTHARFLSVPAAPADTLDEGMQTALRNLVTKNIQAVCIPVSWRHQICTPRKEN